MPVFRTACPRNCYSTCALTVTVEDGRLVAVEPDPANLATQAGPCLKGLAYVDRQHHSDRILHPLRRRADGSFARVSWSEALDEIAQQLIRVRNEHGPQAVLFYAGSGTKGLLNGCALAFWRRCGGCTTTYGDLCWPAGLEATRLTLGDNLHNAPWDLANARLIVMWGKNAAETNIHQMRYVDDALDAGARLIVIDPRRTQTSERAAALIQPRPGSDGYLALAVARMIIDALWIDEAFVRPHVHGYDEYAAMVRSYDLNELAACCDVPLDAIAYLAESIGTIKPATICAGFGMQRYTNSGQTMRALLSLLAITGNIGRPGAGWIYANLQSQIFGEKDPWAFFPPAEPDGVVRVSVSTARLGRDMLAQTDPPLRFAWVERGNPLSQNPETHRVREAFRALDFRVVVEQFLTDTAAEADIVLPAKTMFEQTDVIGAYWHDYLQLRPQVMPPPPGVRPETEIYRALAVRLGCDGASPAGATADDGGGASGATASEGRGPADATSRPAGTTLDDEIPGPDDAAVRCWLERRLVAHGLSLADFAEGPVLAPGRVEIAFADRVFPTPSGKIELSSAEAAARWGVDPLPRPALPVESALRGDGAAPPLQLLTPNTKNRIHSQFGNLPMIAVRDPAPELEIHPDDAAEREIAPGERVRMFNARGSMESIARIDAGIRRGCVAVANGWWGTQGGPVNLLSRGRETDIAHGAAFHDNLVEVEPAVVTSKVAGTPVGKVAGKIAVAAVGTAGSTVKRAAPAHDEKRRKRS